MVPRQVRATATASGILLPSKRWWYKPVKYITVTRISLANSLAYAGDVFSRSAFMAMVLFVFAQLWAKALPGGATMAGFDTGMMVWYMMLTESITLSRPRIEGEITAEVKSGAIAYQLIRPYSYVLYYLFNSFGVFLARWVVNTGMGGLIAWLLVGAPTCAPAALPLVLVAIMLGGCLSFLVAIILALTAFWFEENSPFFWIYSKLLFTLGGLFVPVEVYPRFLQQISRALPFEYMISGPARAFVKYDWPFLSRLLYGQLFWCIVLLALAGVIYAAGVKRVHVQGG